MKMQEDEIEPGGFAAMEARAWPEADCDAGRKVDQSLAYMRANLDRPLQVATLAALAKTSPSHFFSLFKRRTGYAPIALFIHLKIRRACELLDESSLKIKEVAAAVGYNDQLYFSRAFKLLARVAPTQYRQLAPHTREAIREAVTPAQLLRAASPAVEPPTRTTFLRPSLIDNRWEDPKPTNHQLLHSKE